MMLPLMDEADTESGSAESVSGSAVSVEAGSQENAGNEKRLIQENTI